MISNILTRIFGSRNERLLKQYGQAVTQINALEPAIGVRYEIRREEDDQLVCLSESIKRLPS